MTALGTATLAAKIAPELDLDALRAYGESLIKVADSLAESRALLTRTAEPKPRFEVYGLDGDFHAVADTLTGRESLTNASGIPSAAQRLAAGYTSRPIGYFGSDDDAGLAPANRRRVFVRAFDLPEEAS